MYENIKIGLLGGDLRQLVLARKLSEAGFETAVWGLGAGICADIGGATRCVDWEDAIRDSAAVILPLPASRDGVMLNCPLSPESSLRLTHIVERTKRDAVILGGMLDHDFSRAAESAGKKIYDYYLCEQLQIKNSLPTAEGALAIAMAELPRTICGSQCAIVGYGRVGKATARVLTSLGAFVTVAARNAEELAYAEINGCSTLRLTAKSSPERDSVLSSLGGFDAIFNTVPAMLFTDEVMRDMPPSPRGAVIIDLATPPGGADFCAAEKHGIRCIRALSLPGKVAPVTAGEIIFYCVLGLLEQAGVIGK